MSVTCTKSCVLRLAMIAFSRLEVKNMEIPRVFSLESLRKGYPTPEELRELGLNERRPQVFKVVGWRNKLRVFGQSKEPEYSEETLNIIAGRGIGPLFCRQLVRENLQDAGLRLQKAEREAMSRVPSLD